MGKKRERNRNCSSIDTLPEDLRKLLDKMLADTSNTYQDIADNLKDEGHDISRSAIGRYALKHNNAAKRLKEAREQTEALVNYIRENQDVEGTELATSILIDGLTRRIATAEDDFDEIPIEKAGRLLVQLQRSTVYKERWRKERRHTIESVEQTIKARMRGAIQNDPALLKKLQQIVSDAAAEEAARDEN